MIADELKDENRVLAKREAQLEQLKREMESAYTWRRLAWEAIKTGCDPLYVSLRYGFPLEAMKRAKKIHEEREAARSPYNESRDLGDPEVLQPARSAEGPGEGEADVGG